LDQAAGAILVLDPAGKIIRASRAAEQLAGETVLLRHFDDVFRLRDPLEKGDCTLERVLARVQREGNLAGFEAAVRRADGRMLDVMVSASFLTGPGGELLGSIVLLSDLSALKRAEEALRKSEERFRALVTASSDAVYRMSPDWSEMRRLYGRDFVAEMETPTRHWLQDIHPDDRSRVMAVVNEAIRTKGIFELEHRVQRVDGSLGWTFSRAVPLQDGNGEILEWFGAASDITERKRAEERLRESQKLESIGLLAGGVAHDFNNILTVIMGSASIALEERSSCEHARSILSAAERASDLTRQLLAYAGKGQVVRQLIDLSELVSRSTDLLRATVPKRVELELSLAPDLPCVEADPSQVEQILMNLVINAGEAISPKTDGLIKIYTRICEVTPDMVREFSGYSVEAGEYVCLEVQDNGAGMNESTVSHVFDPFFTTKFSGRGLGLAAVHGIVRSSKGLIRLRSHPGEGTTFQVFLPATRRMESTERKVPTLEDAGALQHGPATVLVVDDEETVRRLARLALNRYGYQVLEAENGKEALEVLRSARSAPDVVLLDQAMPVMGGDELLPILAVKYPGLKILMSSGYPEEEACKASPAGTITSFLRKPYTISALAEKIAETLRRAR
jgi:PAS domain S-box-containing protein